MQRRLLLLAAAAVGVALWGAWYIRQAPAPVEALSTVSPSASPVPLVSTDTLAPPSLNEAEPEIDPFALQPSDETLSVNLSAELAKGTLPYEAAIISIQRSAAPPAMKARALFALLPRVPEEGLTTAAEQAAAWTPDRDFAALAAQLLTASQTHGSVQSALFADLMKRPDAIALPTLLQIARTPDHPLAASARDNLSLLLGNDAAQWEKLISQGPPR